MTIFRYKPEVNRNGIVTRRPVARVFLKSTKGTWIQFDPYIDSGADITLVPLGIAQLVGLKFDQGDIQEIGGVRGNVPVVYLDNRIRIGKVEFSARIACALIENIPPLLGRADVFDRFDVTFKQKEDIIFFEERK